MSRSPGVSSWHRSRLVALGLIVWWGLVAEVPRPAPAAEQLRRGLIESVERRGEETWADALQIWQWAEPGYQEVKSAELLAARLEAAGFEVRRGVAEIPTALVASYGTGEPVIGILGEYDALPGLSQQVVPERTPRADTEWGHACGHHLFGAASASAAIAVAEQIAAGKLSGTVRFYGCPAEEGGSGKVFMVRAGLFEDCDAVLHWHPGSVNSAGDPQFLARIGVKFRFHGQSAHAGASPEQGRSALDAVAVTNYAAELMREHTPDFTRIHHVITSGGSAPNVVPEFAEVYYYIRHPKAEVVRSLYDRLVNCAKAGALATDTRLEINYLGGTWESLPNGPLSQQLFKNLQSLNDLTIAAEDEPFATRIQNTLSDPQPLASTEVVVDSTGTQVGGSTDVGDVSWVVPTAGFTTVCWVPGTPGHSWQAVAAGATGIGRDGMLLATKVLATTTADLLTDPALVTAVKQEHARRLGTQTYAPLLEEGQAPPLDYRN